VSVGKLYRLSDKKFIGYVNYQVYHHPAATNWWGELTPVDYDLLGEGEMYVIELEDKRRSKCSLKKRVNQASTGLPPRYTYHITGYSAIE